MADRERNYAMARARARADRLLRSIHPGDWEYLYQVTLRDEGIDPQTLVAQKRNRLGTERSSK